MPLYWLARCKLSDAVGLAVTPDVIHIPYIKSRPTQYSEHHDTARDAPNQAAGLTPSHPISCWIPKCLAQALPLIDLPPMLPVLYIDVRNSISP